MGSLALFSPLLLLLLLWGLEVVSEQASLSMGLSYFIVMLMQTHVGSCKYTVTSTAVAACEKEKLSTINQQCGVPHYERTESCT